MTHYAPLVALMTTLLVLTLILTLGKRAVVHNALSAWTTRQADQP